MFIYNKLYIKDLIGAGFKTRSIASGDIDFVANRLGLLIPKLESIQ